MAERVPVVRLAGFYLAYFAILGILLPYWPLYLQQAGYDPAVIGLVMAVMPATRIVSPAFWGWLADRTGHTLRLIHWTGFLAGATFALIVWRDRPLFWLLATVLAFSFCWNATLPLFEAVTLSHLARQLHRYSRVRLWGSIGFLLAVWGMGELLDRLVPIGALPWAIAGLLVGQWSVSLAVPPIRERHPMTANVSLRAILRRGEVVGFFLSASLLQMAHGPYYAFYSLHLEALGFTDSEIGQLWALGVLAEIVLFSVLGRVHHYVGLRPLLLGSLALSGVRWLLIGWGGARIGLLILAQLLHAASFGSAHAAAVQIVHRNFQGPHHAKGQALYSSLAYGVGGAIGSLYSGLLWQGWGASWIFTSAAGISLLALVAAWPRVGR